MWLAVLMCIYSQVCFSNNVPTIYLRSESAWKANTVIVCTHYILESVSVVDIIVITLVAVNALGPNKTVSLGITLNGMRTLCASCVASETGIAACTVLLKTTSVTLFWSWQSYRS